MISPIQTVGPEDAFLPSNRLVQPHVDCTIPKVLDPILDATKPSKISRNTIVSGLPHSLMEIKMGDADFMFCRGG